MRKTSVLRLRDLGPLVAARERKDAPEVPYLKGLYVVDQHQCVYLRCLFAMIVTEALSFFHVLASQHFIFAQVNVGMAVIGEPPMVFLDEPSAGMDPVARRGMWSVIQDIQWAPKGPPNEDPPKSGLGVSVCSFSSLRPMIRSCLAASNRCQKQVWVFH